MAKRRGSGEGSVYQRKVDGKWAGQLDLGFSPEGKRLRKFVYAGTQKEAIGKLRDLERQREEGRDLAAKPETVEAFLTRWLRDVVEPNRAVKTTSHYRDITRLHLLPTLGRIRLIDLGAEHVQALLIAKRKDGLSPRTCHHIRAVLRVALNQAIRWNIINRNAAAMAEPPRQSDERVEPHSPDEVHTILAATADDRLHIAYRLALTLGLRQGEILGLSWDAIDFERGRLHVRQALQRQTHAPDAERGERSRLVLKSPKTAKSRRTLAMPASLVTALRKRREEYDAERVQAGDRWLDSGLVITTKTGGALEPRALIKAWHDAQERAGVPRRRFHSTRHAAASTLMGAGLPTKVVQEVLGHTLVGTTLDLYGHLTERAFDEAADAMERALSAA